GLDHRANRRGPQARGLPAGTWRAGKLVQRIVSSAACPAWRRSVGVVDMVGSSWWGVLLLPLAAPLIGGALTGDAHALTGKEPEKLAAHRAIYEMTLDDA